MTGESAEVRYRRLAALHTGRPVVPPSAEEVQAEVDALLAMTDQEREAVFDECLPGWREWR